MNDKRFYEQKWLKPLMTTHGLDDNFTYNYDNNSLTMRFKSRRNWHFFKQDNVKKDVSNMLKSINASSSVITLFVFTWLFSGVSGILLELENSVNDQVTFEQSYYADSICFGTNCPNYEQFLLDDDPFEIYFNDSNFDASFYAEDYFGYDYS